MTVPLKGALCLIATPQQHPSGQLFDFFLVGNNQIIKEQQASLNYIYEMNVFPGLIFFFLNKASGKEGGVSDQQQKNATPLRSFFGNSTSHKNKCLQIFLDLPFLTKSKSKSGVPTIYNIAGKPRFAQDSAVTKEKSWRSQLSCHPSHPVVLSLFIFVHNCPSPCPSISGYADSR